MLVTLISTTLSIIIIAAIMRFKKSERLIFNMIYMDYGVVAAVKGISAIGWNLTAHIQTNCFTYDLLNSKAIVKSLFYNWDLLTAVTAPKIDYSLTWG